MEKVWHLIQCLLAENSNTNYNVSPEMALLIGARRHLEVLHEKQVLNMIGRGAQAYLGEVADRLCTIHSFLRIHLRKYGALDFDASDARGQAPVNTTWQQIYFCLRTGYYDEARYVALSSRISHRFAAQLDEWISNGGMVSQETAEAATKVCDCMVRRMGDGIGRPEYEKKLILNAIISGSHKQRHWFPKGVRELIFNEVEDFLWFLLGLVRDRPAGRAASMSVIVDEGTSTYSLDDLQVFLKRLQPFKSMQDRKFPLVYPYMLLMSLQFLPAVIYLAKETSRDEGFIIDGLHLLIALADQGVLSDIGFGKAASLIRQYGSAYMKSGNISAALEYYVQAASAMAGEELALTGAVDEQKGKGHLMLKQLLTELLFSDGGRSLLLGGEGDEGELSRFLTGSRALKFMVEAREQCESSQMRKQISNYIASAYPSTSSTSAHEPISCGRRQTAPRSRAVAYKEWSTSGGKCIYCRDDAGTFLQFSNWVKHRETDHKKDLRD